MQEQYIKLSDLYRVKGIGGKTIDRIKETLLQEKNDTYNNKNIKHKDTFDLSLNNFYIGESVQFMKDNIPDNFVDLTVTSPPYDDLRKYEGFVFDYKSMAEELYRVTKDGGVVVWIVGDQTIKGSETGTSFKHALYFKEIGFNLHDTMIYQKDTQPCHDPRNKRYKQYFEYMFVFSKGKPNTYNEIQDVPTKNAGKILKKATKRKPDGEMRHFTEEGRVVQVKEFMARSNIWKFNTDKRRIGHPAIFPEALAKDHIVTWSNEGDIILDPMCGSGTTCKMAYLNKRNFIGIDMSEEYINDICIPRLKDYGWNPNNHQYNNKGDI